MITVEGTRVLVKPDKKEEVSAGGILLPQQTQDSEARAKTQGTFMAMGPNADLNFGEKTLNPGDRIAFVRYAGENIQDEDEILWIMQDEDILAIIE